MSNVKSLNLCDKMHGIVEVALFENGSKFIRFNKRACPDVLTKKQIRPTSAGFEANGTPTFIMTI